MSLTVDFKIVEQFLDTRQVENSANAAGLKTLGRLGGLVRKISRQSLRRRKASAAPNQPPSTHAESKVAQTSVEVRGKNGKTRIQKSGGRRNQITLKNILYGVDRASLSMVCGPVGLNQPKVSGFTVPELMEKGGTIQRREQLVGDQWRAARSSRRDLPTRVRAVEYAPHPFMVPAREKATESLPGLWN